MTAFDQSFISQMRRNRDVLFFALNAFGWISWGLAQYIGVAIYEKHDDTDTLLASIAVTTGFSLTIVLRYICRILWRQRPAILISVSLLSAYLLALIMRIIINSADLRFATSGESIDHWYEIFAGVMWSSYLMVCWLGLYFGFRFYEANQQERETALRAMALAQAAQLKMLRYQLNPHFLFNTLNAISTLVLDKKNALANTVLAKLADFLRYTLDQDPMKTVTLTQEMIALNLYLDIEKMRFGSRLEVATDIDPSAASAQVPSLLLQPLIENAIKYAIAPSEPGGRICLGARIENSSLILSVEDTGPGIIDHSRIDSGRGVGLRNTRERLYAMYGERAQIEFSNVHPGLRITLTFPVQSIALSHS